MNAAVYELKKLRERRHVFQNRSAAGTALGLMMEEEYAHIESGMILAIPSGGIPVGLKVKEKLELPFDLVIVRKLQIPGNHEAGFGAMTLDGSAFFNKYLLKHLQLSDAQVEDEKKRVAGELKKRNALFRKGRPFPDLAGKRTILVDDGLASGFTMLASVHMVKKAEAAEIIVAVPTAPQRSIDLLAPEADRIYCANIRTAPYFAVAEAYREWYDLDEREVLALLGDLD